MIMCTSLTYSTVDGHHFLARTMDFSFELNGNPLFLPRQYQWQPVLEKNTVQNQYAVMGAGAKLGDQYLVADGFNEHGLGCAELYFAHEAVYESQPVPTKLNLVAEEFIVWVLGNHQSLEEVAADLDNVRIIESDQGVMGANQPLHWILADRSGKTMVIEPRGEGLQLIDDPVGVMTNTPDLDWHLKNLSNYLNLQPQPFTERPFGNYQAGPFSQGTGTQALPGSYTPPDRFVRAAYSRQYMPEANNVAEGVNHILHILDNVTIPKGVNIGSGGSSDYTQYQGISGLNNLAYYMVNYDNRHVYQTNLTTDLIENQKEPLIYTLPHGQQNTVLN